MFAKLLKALFFLGVVVLLQSSSPVTVLGFVSTTRIIPASLYNHLKNKIRTKVQQSHIRTLASSLESSALHATDASSTSTAVPSLIVLDLDNTLWTPELYQLRKLERNKQYPVANKDVKLFPAIQSILSSIKKDLASNGGSSIYSETKFAIASRTKSVEWAHDLLKQFDLTDFFHYVEIFPGDKKRHFANLKSQSGIDYHDMLFFDDSRDGRYGNCEPVSELGALTVHCPNGIYEEKIWHGAIESFGEWYTEKPANTIIEWDGTLTTTSTPDIDPTAKFKGFVKYVNYDKRFGFIKYGSRDTKDMFFHFSSLPAGADVEEGDEVSFGITHDQRKGKDAARDVELKNGGGDADTVNMRVFSMNLPFAALLANGYKTLETRNGTMFTPYEEGTKMLLHVGQRIYPDGNRHLDVMKSGGLDDDEINDLKSLPNGFGKGMAVAIVEIGKTYETTLEKRCDPDFQRSVGAFGADSGMRATEIARVEYLKKGVKVTGSGGVFKAAIDKSVIPDGWLG